MSPYPPHTPSARLAQSGAGALEFLMAAVPVLLIGLSAIELAHAMKIRQVVNLALHEAARAGSTNHAHPQAIQQAFEAALLPLFAGSTSVQRQQAQQRTFQAKQSATGRAPWQLTLLSPSPQAFQAYAAPWLRISQRTGLAAVSNNYLAEQHRSSNAGSAAALTENIFQANTLALRAHYLYRPLLPGVAAMLKLFGKRGGSFARHALSHGYLPLQQELAVLMQSHPVLWPMPANGTVLRAHQETAHTAGAALPAPDTCHGLWCVNAGQGGFTPTQPAAFHGTNGTTATPGAGVVGGNASNTPTLPLHPIGAGPTISPNDPACGVSLCCLPAD